MLRRSPAVVAASAGIGPFSPHAEPDFARCVDSDMAKCGNLRATEVVLRVGLNLWFVGWYPSRRIRAVQTGFDGLPRPVGNKNRMIHEFSGFAVVAKLADAHA